MLYMHARYCVAPVRPITPFCGLAKDKAPRGTCASPAQETEGRKKGGVMSERSKRKRMLPCGLTC